ncbi:hypothetical protein [Nesterenkonia populi]|uniref:hypothetical protein n=1 Tax=Nesterenkonia populi TaxID=1591087 RepID=UPI0011BFB471|nr:hypothetical protein [Nesterenkonia populi]
MRIHGTEEIDRFVSDLNTSTRRNQQEVRRIMRRAGVEMSRSWRELFQGSRSFRQVARSIDFDFMDSTAFGARNFSVEVGPNAAKDPSAALAGIATFGSSRPGGATVAEPDPILEREADTAVQWIEQQIGQL